MYWGPSLGIWKKKYKQSSLKQGPRGDLEEGKGKQKIIRVSLKLIMSKYEFFIWWHLIIVFFGPIVIFLSWSIGTALKTDPFLYANAHSSPNQS